MEGEATVGRRAAVGSAKETVGLRRWEQPCPFPGRWRGAGSVGCEQKLPLLEEEGSPLEGRSSGGKKKNEIRGRGSSGQWGSVRKRKKI